MTMRLLSVSKARSVKVNLNERASKDLEVVSQELGLTASEVLRKGLAVMSLYAQLKEYERSTGERSGLMLREGEETRELLIA